MTNDEQKKSLIDKLADVDVDELMELLLEHKKKKAEQEKPEEPKGKSLKVQDAKLSHAEKKIAEAVDQHFDGRAVPARPRAEYVNRQCVICNEAHPVIQGGVLDRKPFRCNKCLSGRRK